MDVLGDGGVNSALLGDGNNTMNVAGTSYVGSVTAYDGADRLTVDGGSIDMVSWEAELTQSL